MTIAPILPPIKVMRESSSAHSFGGLGDSCNANRVKNSLDESLPKLHGHHAILQQSMPASLHDEGHFRSTHRLNNAPTPNSTLRQKDNVRYSSDMGGCLQNAVVYSPSAPVTLEPHDSTSPARDVADSQKTSSNNGAGHTRVERLQRTGWWRTDSDRQEQMSIVRDLLRQQPLTLEHNLGAQGSKILNESLSTTNLPSRQTTPQTQQTPTLTSTTPSELDIATSLSTPQINSTPQHHIHHIDHPPLHTPQTISRAKSTSKITKTTTPKSMGSAPAAEVYGWDKPSLQSGSDKHDHKPPRALKALGGVEPELSTDQNCTNITPMALEDSAKKLKLALMDNSSLKNSLAKAEKKIEAVCKSKRALSDSFAALLLIQSEYIQERIPDTSLINYFLKRGLNQTLACFCKETKNSCGENIENYLRLKSLMSSRKFTEAIEFVQSVQNLEVSTGHQRAIKPSLIPSFEDLVYVLSKYLLIHMYQTQQQSATVNILEKIIVPLVKREYKRGGVRAEWFSADYQLLYDLIHNNGLNENNIYRTFNWKLETTRFWDSARAVGSQKDRLPPSGPSPPPLFAYALAEHFFADDRHLASAKDFEQIAIDAERWNRVDSLVKSYQGGNIDRQHEINDVKADSHVSEHPDSDSYKKASTQPQKYGPKNSPMESSTRSRTTRAEWQNVCEPSDDLPLKCNPKENDKMGIPPLPKGAIGKGNQRHQYQSSYGSSSAHDRVSRASAGVQNLGPDLPPKSHNSHETVNFALSNVCGPSIAKIRVLDIRDIPDTGQVIVATAGSEDRHSKGISFWEMRSGALISHLDNGTVKHITSLLFHPSFPELLLSADMEFDVKLWNWREGKVVRWWRKHHSRVINRISSIPGDDTRAASCSGDQSLKIWNIHAEKPQSSSIHSNEPITSFVFSGSTSDPTQQKVIVSLSFSIRIYKLRTLSMLVTIPLGDLKISKTPVTSLASHPVHDTFVLISTDNQLRLFNLLTQEFVKTYSARLIESGTRIRGEFSPCGTFVYATATDIRQPSSRPINQGSKGGLDDTSAASLQYGHDSSPSSHDREEAHGVFIWRVHTGKLEKEGMNAMNMSDGWGHSGIPVNPCKMTISKWTTIKDNSRKGKTVERKVLLATGDDRLVRLYL
ncbi:hypothetical protein BASA83_007409 [Batrachochytrium salamandrivorans]|nr:hypothetical protein BASA83_007409 [Batrachochytrium salamandrivorans]